MHPMQPAAVAGGAGASPTKSTKFFTKLLERRTIGRNYFTHTRETSSQHVSAAFQQRMLEVIAVADNHHLHCSRSREN